jgi:hypothetical protein
MLRAHLISIDGIYGIGGAAATGQCMPAQRIGHSQASRRSQQLACTIPPLACTTDWIRHWLHLD